MTVAGFAGAPVSKTLSIVVTVATFAVLSNKSQQVVSLVGYRIFGEEGQWWRLFTSLLPLASVWEWLLTLQLIRVFRVLERHMGSSKFGSFLFLTAALAKSVELALCVQFPFLRPPPGPLSVLSALAITYYGYIPFTTPAYFTTGSIRVTEKVFAYAAVLLLALHDTWSSLAPAVCGVAVALLYCSNLAPFQRFRFPGQRLIAVCGSMIPGGDQIAARRTQMARLQQRETRMGGRQGQAEHLLGTMPAAGARPATGLRQRTELPPPSEEDVALLMGLGFDRDAVVQMLRLSGNNTEAAASRLVAL